MVRVDGLTNEVAKAPYFADYIADWSWLLQQGVPLSGSDAVAGAKQLSLGAPFVEDQTPVGIYSLLIDIDENDPNKPYVPFRSRFGTENPAPAATGKLVFSADPQKLEDELRSSKVNFIVTPEVRSARVAYQTRDKWVQQLSVAAAAYKPFIGAASFQPAEPWRDYYVGDDNFLYFHAGEAGKTISVSYLTTDANGPLVDRPFVIETLLVNAPKGFYNGLSARVKLTDKNGNRLPDNSTGTPNLISIQAVNGTSITSRTAYVNGTKYAQKLDTTTRGAN